MLCHNVSLQNVQKSVQISPEHIFVRFLYGLNLAKLNADLLDDLTIKAARSRDAEYTLRDGNGLFLLIHPNGGKYFHLRTTLHGKPKKIQLGTYPELSLSDARKQSRDKRKQVKVDHIDPTLEGKLAKQRKAKDANNTFKKIAEEWLAIKQHTLAPST